ncbi:MAG TPA: acyl-CoA dehydrogenase family protein [Acidimicrobiales bacterium]|nr:acyl-CoA dehydrogenase family protein [Acidimicrobiales bacterium]
MDFELDKATGAFRAEVRSFMRTHVTEDVLKQAHETGTMHNWDLHRALAARGWIALSWPVEYGGLGRDPVESAVFFEEANYAAAPLYGMNTTMVAARALLRSASEELKQAIIPKVLAGEIIICLGFSEPDSGSDVAAAKTRAVRDGGQWMVNGQKVFTSTAEECAYVFLLTRTNVDVAKHQGLTTFLVPMNSEGIEIAPIHTLGERTNMTFYRDVRVDDAWRVGEVDRGWDVMTGALSFERGGHGFHGHMIRVLEQATAALAPRSGAGRSSRAAEELGRFAAEVEVCRLLDHRTAWLAAQGGLAGVEGSMAKLYSSERYTAFCATALDLLGPEGLLQNGDDGAPAGGALEYAHRFATPTTVYGGSSEVQRSIIAERGLGLPRSR